jgi:integrase
MGDFISALLDTGYRQGELRSLQFSHVRWKENVFLLTADKTKTRKALAIASTAGSAGCTSYSIPTSSRVTIAKPAGRPRRRPA